MASMLLLLLVPVLLLDVATAHLSPQSHIRFHDSAYSGITVSFSPDIQSIAQRERYVKDLQVSNRIRVVR